jgi:hypothetical protein
MMSIEIGALTVVSGYSYRVIVDGDRKVSKLPVVIDCLQSTWLIGRIEFTHSPLDKG